MSMYFKKCPCCAFIWKKQIDFLNDSQVKILGYTANFKRLSEGLFFFTHKTCRTSMTIKTLGFKNLYDGPVYAIPLTGTEVCPSYCLRKENLQACSAECECAYVREIIQIIKKWRKKSKAVHPPSRSRVRRKRPRQDLRSLI